MFRFLITKVLFSVYLLAGSAGRAWSAVGTSVEEREIDFLIVFFFIN